MHDLRTDTNHQRLERQVRHVARAHHQLDRRRMNKTLVTFAVVLALAGCAKQPIVGQAALTAKAYADAQANFKALQAATQASYAAAQVRLSKESPEELQADDAEELADNLAQRKAGRAFAATHTAQEVAAAWCTERGQELDQCVMYEQYVKKAPTKAPTIYADGTPYRCASNGSTDGSVYCPTAYDLAQHKLKQDWAATHTAQETAEARAQLAVVPDMMNGESREHFSVRQDAWMKLRSEIPYTSEESAELRAKANRMLANADYSRNCQYYGTASICTDKDNQYVESCVVVPGRGTVCTTKEMGRSHSVVSTTISPVYLRKTSGN